MTTAICYTTKTGENYLSYETYRGVESAEAEVRALNTTKPARLWNGDKVDWTKVDKFFVVRQEHMD
jgi:hypothetical protein